MDNILYTQTSAADELGISYKTFKKWACILGLDRIKYSRGYLYSQEDIEEVRVFMERPMKSRKHVLRQPKKNPDVILYGEREIERRLSIGRGRVQGYVPAFEVFSSKARLFTEDQIKIMILDTHSKKAPGNRRRCSPIACMREEET